jgi:hypothetical protein
MEPVHLLIKLTLLAFKSKGTKLGFFDNTVYFRDNSYYSSGMRWYFSESRDDLYSILKPLAFGLPWLVKHNPVMFDNIHMEIISSLTELRQNYKKDHEIRDLIEKYKSIVEIFSKDKNFLKISPSILTDNNKYPGKVDDAMMDSIWKPTDLDIVNNYIDILKKIRSSQNKSYLDSTITQIETILEDKTRIYKTLLVR